MGRGVLLLVPEIALTPAVAATFRRAFGDRVAIQHSGLSDGERHDQWQRIRRGDVDVVVGTRSAVFAPLRTPGLIIVDEEHDGSYKQEESPRYHGRDVAVVRARMPARWSCSARRRRRSRATTTRRTAATRSSTLEKRVLDRPMADVRIVDMREEYAAAGPDVILSCAAVRRADGAARRRGAGDRAAEPPRIRHVRRSAGSAASTLECPNCSCSLTVHRAARRARCHYCNYAMPVPKVVREVRRRSTSSSSGSAPSGSRRRSAPGFPDARVARVDRDTIRRRGAIAALLARFAAGELDVLVGTQMIAKGHDFPRVTLVGVISADVGLGPGGFPRRRADVPAADAGRRPRRARRDPGRGDRADALPEPLQHPPRLPSGLRSRSTGKRSRSGRRCAIRRPSA